MRRISGILIVVHPRVFARRQPCHSARRLRRLLSWSLRIVARARAAVGATTRNQVGNGHRDGSNDKAPQLSVFLCILLLESVLLILAHVGAANVADLLHDEKHNLFGASVARESVLRLSYISAGDVSRSVDGERNTVGHLLAPAFGVEPWIVPDFLDRVNVDPSLLVLGINFRPNVIFRIPDPTNAAANCPAEHAEAIGPFAYAATSCLK